jgi:hypothetical protein
MSHTAIAAHDVPSLILPSAYADSPARERISPGQPGLWSRLAFWLAELVRLVAVVYLFAIAILAVGIPIALAINALLFAAGWVWKAL